MVVDVLIRTGLGTGREGRSEDDDIGLTVKKITKSD